MNENEQCKGGVCKTEKNECADKCGCCGYGHKNLLRWVIKIIVALIIASFAYHLGEMKGEFESMFGRMHHGFYGYGGQNMMYDNYGWDAGVPISGMDSGTVPAVPAVPTR